MGAAEPGGTAEIIGTPVRTSGWMWGRSRYTLGGWSPWFGVLAGILAINSAIVLYTDPSQRWCWSTTIIIVSALDFFLGMGGFAAGAFGGIGGTLATHCMKSSRIRPF
jgi:hypothetical protein